MKAELKGLATAVLILVVTFSVLGWPQLNKPYPQDSPITSLTDNRSTSRVGQGNREPDANFNFASSTIEGILDPVTVEQRGYTTSSTQSVRNDVYPLIEYNLPLDDEHGWVGSQAEVNITDLKRLYVVNGTFENGIPGQNIIDATSNVTYYPFGWNATASNPNEVAQVQVAAYDDSGTKFVVVENQGLKIGPSGKQYDHRAGTEVIWYQLINNSPYTEDFYLSFDYYYLRGPLGTGVTGEGRIFAMVDEEIIWNTSIPDLPSRGSWFSVDNLPVTLTDPGSVLNFSIGFVVDETFDLNADEDNDGDGYA
ncbi:MAG: hypothetical protein ACFE7R_02010, partial [Candidatus Hodarchaeota archaeon]